MTLQEKILQLHQEGGFNTAENLRLGIPGFFMADGPHGVRDGLATAYPVGISMAATWDTDLINRVGISMGKEFRGKGKNQALGPCMDLTRDPRNGRTPESGGEDPFLCANITTSLIKGIQNSGCIATAKHFNADSRQLNRTNNNYMISQRTLVEHLGWNYRSAVQEGGVLSVMNAYNLINGQKCAENYNLLTTILRGIWGYPSYVVSDWGSIWTSKNAIQAGCNVCMGSDNYTNDLLNLVTSGSITEDTINASVRKVLRTKILSGMMDYYPSGNPDDVNSTLSKQMALECARKSIVLLKNINNVLPLNKNSVNKIAVIGPSADVCQLDGTGSSYVTPFYSVSPRQGILNKISSEKIIYAKGCDINSTSTNGYTEALTAASLADYVIFFGGLDGSQEGEGLDRVGESINLPGQQQDLINQLSLVNPNIIVVLESGGICGIQNCKDNIKGLIYAFYPGQEGGNALADVIFGDYNPAGRLPVTYPMTDAQLPDRNFNFDDDFGCGYRWFDKQNIIPLYAFGYGLSYTQFQYSNLSITPSIAPIGSRISVSADIKNTGFREGEEVVQLYISDTHSSFTMSVKQLKGFKRIQFQPGETKQVTFSLTSEEFYYYDELSASYKVNPGSFVIKVGGSSDNLPLTGDLNLQDAELKPDLRISWIKTMPVYPIKGDTVIFMAAVKNQGTGISPAGSVYKINFKINGQLVSSTSEQTSVKPGSMSLISTRLGIAGENGWIAPQTGNYSLEATVDPDNIISECIEDNNTFTSEFVVSSIQPVNLAKNRNVVVSSVEAVGLEGSKAVDGNRGSRWSSQFSDPQYIYIDFGSVIHFNRIDLYWESAFGKDYTIQTSNDTSNWNLFTLVTNGDGGLDRINLSGDARFIKMSGIHRGTQYGYSLYEFEVYNDSADTFIHGGINETPTAFHLYNNYPNPFNPGTNIGFEIPKQGNVKLIVFNSIGQQICSLVDQNFSAGTHRVVWNGKDSWGKEVPTGIYFYRLTSGGYSETKKMIFIK
jgi:beta-glucosidase